MNVFLLLIILSSATQPLSLNQFARSITEKSLDIIRGGLVDYDFARVEIDKVMVKLETSTVDNLRFMLVMEGVGQRRTQFTNHANDGLWNDLGQNLVSLSVTANCFSEPRGLAGRQGLTVLEDMKVTNLAKPFRYLSLADTFSMKAGPTQESLNRKTNMFMVTTPLRGSLNIAVTPYTCIIVQSH